MIEQRIEINASLNGMTKAFSQMLFVMLSKNLNKNMNAIFCYHYFPIYEYIFGMNYISMTIKITT